METGRGDRYAYDPEGQLYQASYRALLGPEPWLTPSDPMRSDSFQYDALGNRYGAAQVASRGPMNFTRRDNGLNQYLMWSPMPVVYDDNWFSPWVPPGNGVTMGDGYITASYNALNQPVAMGSMGLGNNFYWFWHDPLGRCVKRWLGNGTGVPTGPITYFYYDGWNLVQEGPNASTADRLYVHGGRVDEIVASKIGGQWYHHQYDARGHCILLTDADGLIREQYDYDAFGFPYFHSASGGQLSAAQQSGNRFLFTGREWIKDLRVYDFRNRHYQPELGRFLQPDPIQFKAGDYNLYRYCHNDPVNKVDPSGLAPAEIGDAADQLAQQTNWQNLAAFKDYKLGIFFRREFASAVNRDGNGLSTYGPKMGESGKVPLQKVISPETILVTHNHTNEQSRDTGTYVSAGDIWVSNRTGLPVYVIAPSGVQERYRPDDSGSIKGRMNNPGVIERLDAGRWVPVDGAKTDIRNHLNYRDWEKGARR